jgi:hypothetical protein
VPAVALRSPWISYALHLVVFAALTLITQVGGVVRLPTLAVQRSAGWPTRVALFVVLYGCVCELLVPPLAARLGRERLPVRSDAPLRSHSFLTVAFKRNDATPTLARAHPNSDGAASA